ncbi:MAG: hypothetical protein AAF467_23425 [Actinomycetota bacterium]
MGNTIQLPRLAADGGEMSALLTIPPATLDDDLRWLYDVLGTASDAGVSEYLVRPSADEPRLLVPIDTPRIAAGAMRRAVGGDLRRDRAMALAARAAGRVGLAGAMPGDRMRLPRFDLVERLAVRLGEPELTAAVTIGPRRRNRKPVLQLIRPDGAVIGFAKVGWSPLTRDLVIDEATVLTAIDGKLPAWLHPPVVIATEYTAELAVVVTSALAPPAVARGPRRSPAEVVTALADTDAAPASAVADLPFLSPRPVAEGVEPLLESADIDRLLGRHGAERVTIGLWHGDFTPWNQAARGDTIALWDWEFAGWGRPVGFDLLHHRFERHRRSPGGSNTLALRVLETEATRVLDALRLDLSRNQVEAIFDCYLVELIAREQRLADQRWSGGSLAALGPVATDLLRRRLQRRP